MKGSPSEPLCGFSATVVSILSHLKRDFYHINVLKDLKMREGIKVFSSWPTIPQLYVNKKFIGGCDIVKKLYENGELLSILE